MSYKVQKILHDIMYNEGSFEYRIIDENEQVVLNDISGEFVAKKICELLNNGDEDLETILLKCGGKVNGSV